MFDDYDSEFGYSLNELGRSYGRKAYKVPDYDLDSLNEIEQCMLNDRYGDRFQCFEHLRYLENLEKQLSLIALAEEREGIMNWELREVLGKVKALSAHLSSFSHSVGTEVVYS